MDNLFFEKAHTIWKKIGHSEIRKNNSFELDINKKVLDIFQVGEYYYFFFNVPEGRFEYVSPEIKGILGYDAENISSQFFLQNIHPEDQPYFLSFETSLHEFYEKLPIEKFNKYKVRYDFRIKDWKGNYVRILHQLIMIDYDDKGSIFRSLGIHTDISHLKEEGIPMLSFVGLEGEPSYINIAANNKLLPSKSVLTIREKQIFKYLAEGKTSNQISEILYISKNTVDTHRKNMLKKTETNSVVEMVSRGIKTGWI